MRFRFLNQMHKSLNPTSSSTLSRAKSPMASSSSVMGATKSSINSMQQPSSSYSRQRLTHLQKRLLSDYDTVRISRVALGVELCSAASSILVDGIADPNLPRGWDAGVDVDDDGG